MVKLHIGCAGIIIRGWNNLDLNPGPGGINYDARTPLPYQDKSASLIYSCHFFEHLDYSEGLFHLQECYRVLVPGGTVRIVVPDMKKHIDQLFTYYETGNASVWKKYVNAVGVDEFNNFYHGDVEHIFRNNTNISMKDGDHKALYTFDILFCRLFEAGFRDIVRSDFRKSRVPEMTNPPFDDKPDFSLFIEAKK